jgi:uncharacterized protein (TIRG00374 family)
MHRWQLGFTPVRKLFGPLLILAIVGSLAFVQRTVLVDIWNRLIELPRISLVPLLGAVVVMIIARGAFLAACSPGVTLRQAVMTDQSALAAGYGIVLGGGLVGTGMRIHMFTRWGVAHISIASSIIATAVVPSFTTWGLPSVLLIGSVLGGTAAREQTLAVAVGIPLIVVSIVFWWLALRSSTMFSAVGRFTGSLRSFLLRKVPARFPKVRRAVERTQPLAFSIEMRDDLVRLLRNRWALIFTASASTLAAGFTCLWTSSVVFNVEGLTFREALIAFSLVRVVIALSPIPGGTGLAEVGLIVLLERAGVSTVDATGTTLLYRSLTWFLPIVVGSATWWRYNHSRSVNLEITTSR